MSFIQLVLNNSLFFTNMKESLYHIIYVIGYALNNNMSFANPIGSREYTNNLPLAIEPIANVSNIELFRLATLLVLGQLIIHEGKPLS